MFGRRMLILVAVLMGLTALAASVSPPPPDSARRQSGATVTPSPLPPSKARQIDVHIDADARRPARIDAAPGETVLLEVTGDVIDTVTISDLSEIETIDPGAPARFEIYVDTRGRFPIDLVEAHRRIGVLEVG
jgi:hypothetical protein